MAKGPAKIGAKVVVDGEKEYKSAIADINKTMAVLASEARKTAAAYSDNKDSLEALQAQTDSYKSQADEQRKKVEVLSEAYENSKKKLGENANATKEWLIKLNNAETALIKTEKALKNSEDALEKQSTAIEKVKDKFKEWEDSINDLKDKHPVLTKAVEGTAGAAQKLVNGGLKAVTGAAAGTAAGVAAVSTAAIAAGKALYDSAAQAASAGDAIDEASQRMRVSAESFQELQYAAKMSGVEVQTLETASKTLAKTAPDMDLSKAINQIASIKDESERSEKAIELFGSKAAYQMGPMLSQGAEGIQALKNQAHDLGLVMSNEAVTASAAFNDSLDNLTGTADAIKNNLSAEFLPGITQIMDGITGVFTGDKGAVFEIENGIVNISHAFEDIIPKVMEIFETISTVIAQVAPTLIEVLSSTLSENIEPILTAAFNILNTLTESLLTEENIMMLVSAALGIVTGLVGFLGDNADLLVDSAFTMVDALIDGLLGEENAEKLVESTLDIVMAIVTGIIENAPEIIVGAAELIGVLVDEIIHYDWWQVAKDIFNSIVDGLKSLVRGDPDGSHAGGLDYVPYDGYRAVLHKGERLLTASEAVVYDRNQFSSSNNDELNRKLDMLLAGGQAPVNVNLVANGSNAAVVRALDIQIKRENTRASAFR